MARSRTPKRGDVGHGGQRRDAGTVADAMFTARSQAARLRLYLDEVRRFENCDYGLKEFSHQAHLKVGWTYLNLYGYDTALVRMRQGLRRFSAHHGKMGYNETITVFWLRLLASHLEESPEKVFRKLGKDELFRYFSRERVMSAEAKREWVEPDLQAMRP